MTQHSGNNFKAVCSSGEKLVMCQFLAVIAFFCVNAGKFIVLVF